ARGAAVRFHGPSRLRHRGVPDPRHKAGKAKGGEIMPDEYDYRADGQQSYLTACQAIRGNAHVRVAQNDPSADAEIVVHRYKGGKCEEFIAPLSLTMLDILDAQIANLRLVLRSRGKR